MTRAEHADAHAAGGTSLARPVGWMTAGLTLGAEVATAEEMHVEMGNCHPTVLADVEGETEAASCHTLGFRERGGDGEHPGERRAMRIAQRARVGDVLLRQDQQVDGRARIDVTKREDQIVVMQLVDGDRAGGHPAEEAVVGHAKPHSPAGRRQASTIVYDASVEPRIQFATTSDGVSIAFSTMGEGPPLVIPPPALPWSHMQAEWRIPEWRHWYEHLGDGRQIIRYDSRGAGLSQREVEEVGLDEWLLDLEAVVDKLGLATFDLHGFYYSSLIALAYAARHPERLLHLVLWCGFASQHDQTQTPEVGNALRSLIDVDWELFTETLAHTLFGWAQGDPAHRVAEYMRESLTPDLAKRCWDKTEQIDLTDQLPRITTPTLILHRREFPLVGLDSARKLASLIPDARLCIVEGASLAPYIGEQETAMNAIEEFIGRAPASAEQHEPTHVHPGGANIGGAFQSILFTDMESSTATTQRLGDADAQQLVRAHNRIVRAALWAHGGHEIKHTGDGIMASFPSASAAVQSALAMQRGFAEHNAERPHVHLGVRIGLNAGEPVAEGDDLFGTAVQVAARVCAQAEPAEVLVSDVVRQLVAGKGFLFADRGETALRGFEDPVRLYEVRWRDE